MALAFCFADRASAIISASGEHGHRMASAGEHLSPKPETASMQWNLGENIDICVKQIGIVLQQIHIMTIVVMNG